MGMNEIIDEETGEVTEVAVREPNMPVMLSADPVQNSPLRTFKQRIAFFSNTNIDAAGCWLWEGVWNDAGYGMFRIDGRYKRAHRLCYEHFFGPIPEGLEPDHLCRVRCCINPLHLEPVTHRENMRRADFDSDAIRSRPMTLIARRNAAKTHCTQGHPYDDENTYYEANGGRRCRICRAALDARRKRNA